MDQTLMDYMHALPRFARDSHFLIISSFIKHASKGQTFQSEWKKVHLYYTDSKEWNKRKWGQELLLFFFHLQKYCTCLHHWQKISLFGARQHKSSCRLLMGEKAIREDSTWCKGFKAICLMKFEHWFIFHNLKTARVTVFCLKKKKKVTFLPMQMEMTTML